MSWDQQEQLLQGLFWELWLLFGATLAFIFVHFQIVHELTLKQFILIYLVWALIWLGFSFIVLRWRRCHQATDLLAYEPQSKNNVQVLHDPTENFPIASSGDSS